MGDKPESTGRAGAIREAGGAFAKLEIAHEEGKVHHSRVNS